MILQAAYALFHIALPYRNMKLTLIVEDSSIDLQCVVLQCAHRINAYRSRTSGCAVMCCSKTSEPRNKLTYHVIALPSPFLDQNKAECKLRGEVV